MIRTMPSAVTNTFCGFRSRWSNRFVCSAWRPANAWPRSRPTSFSAGAGAGDEAESSGPCRNGCACSRSNNKYTAGIRLRAESSSATATSVHASTSRAKCGWRSACSRRRTMISRSVRRSNLAACDESALVLRFFGGASSCTRFAASSSPLGDANLNHDAKRATIYDAAQFVLRRQPPALAEQRLRVVNLAEAAIA